MSLYGDWLRDSAIGFASRLVLAAGPENYAIQSPVAFEAADLAMEYLEGVQTTEIANLTPASLDALAALADLNLHTQYGPPGTAVAAVVHLAQARRAEWREQLPLLRLGVRLFCSANGSLSAFIDWAARMGDDKKAWRRTPWRKLRRNLAAGDSEREEADIAWRALTGPDREVVSLDCLHEALGRPSFAAWHVLARVYLSAQHVRPLLALPLAGRDGDVGTSLPFGISARRKLDPDEHTIYLRLGAEEKSPDPARQAGDLRRLLPTAVLHANLDWLRPLREAAIVARELWAGQNGRLADQSASVLAQNTRFDIDLGPADSIVRAVFGDSAEELLPALPLQGPSSGPLFAIAMVARLLPGAALPAGSITAKFVGVGGWNRTLKTPFELANVGAEEAKLAYAQSSPHSRLVVARGSHLGISLDDALEVSRVSNLFQACAQLLPPSLWRFGVLRGLLVQVARVAEDRELGDRAYAEGSRAEFEALDRQLLGVPDVRFRSVRTITSAVSDEALGRWLARVDRCFRYQSQRPVHADDDDKLGLGAVILRTQPGDTPMRWWAALFELLGRKGEEFERFQWASADEAAAQLAEMLGPSSSDGKLGCRPPPDLLVILDDAGYLQRDPDRLFGDHFHGNWEDLLPQARSNQPSRLEAALDRLQLAARRSNALGKIRVLIVERPAQPDQLDAADFDLPAETIPLGVFRHGFTLTQAMTVLRGFAAEGSQHDLLVTTRSLLNRLSAQRFLLYWDGRYQFTPPVKKWLLADPELHPLYDNIELHWAAARSFSALLEPEMGNSLNVDDVHDGEADLEAAWHLREVGRLLALHAHFREQRPMYGRARRRFELGRAFVDWDTVQSLARSESAPAGKTLADELWVEMKTSGRRIHAAQVARWLDALIRAAQHGARTLMDAELTEARERYLAALNEASSAPQKWHLKSAFACVLRLPASTDAAPCTERSIEADCLDRELLAQLKLWCAPDRHQLPLHPMWLEQAVDAAQTASLPTTDLVLLLKFDAVLNGTFASERWLRLIACPALDPKERWKCLEHWQRARDSVIGSRPFELQWACRVEMGRWGRAEGRSTEAMIDKARQAVLESLAGRVTDEQWTAGMVFLNDLAAAQQRPLADEGCAPYEPLRALLRSLGEYMGQLLDSSNQVDHRRMHALSPLLERLGLREFWIMLVNQVQQGKLGAVEYRYRSLLLVAVAYLECEPPGRTEAALQRVAEADGSGQIATWAKPALLYVLEQLTAVQQQLDMPHVRWDEPRLRRIH